MISTTVAVMAEISPQLPTIIFCLLAMVSSLISLLLPETHGSAMPDTAEQSEEVKLVRPGKVCQWSVGQVVSEEEGARLRSSERQFIDVLNNNVK